MIFLNFIYILILTTFDFYEKYWILLLPFALIMYIIVRIDKSYKGPF